MIPFRLALLAALPAAAAPAFAAPASSAAISVQTTEPSPLVTNAWDRVAQARTWMQQAHEVHAFLNAITSTGRRGADLTMDARNIASGRVVRLDDPALLRRPQDHEVTLVLDGRFYVFRPLSRASLEPLLRR